MLPNLGKWYLITFESGMLFHNNNMPFHVVIESDSPFTVEQIITEIENETYDDNKLRKKIKKVDTLEQINKLFDKTWKRCDGIAFAILQPGDMGKLIEIMSHCASDGGWRC